MELTDVKEAITSYANILGKELPKASFLQDEFLAATESSKGFELLGNYPNPFNPSTTIGYSLPFQSSIELVIYDIMGREVKSFNISSQSAE